MSLRLDPLRILTGRAWAFGFGVTAELIVPRERWGQRDPARWLMTPIDPAFPERLTPGDILVGGEDFAGGTIDETPARAIREAGAGAVVAYSFDPRFAAHAVALGLPAVAVNEALGISSGAQLRVDLEGFRVVNLSSGDRYPIRNLSDEILESYRRALAASD